MKRWLITATLYLAFFGCSTGAVRSPAAFDDTSICNGSNVEFRESFRHFGTYDVVRHDSKSDAADRHGLTDDERIAIYEYTQGTLAVNAALRSSSPELAKFQPFITAVNCGLRKLPSYRGEVFRLTTLPAAVLVQYFEGAVVTDPGFLSTYRDLRFSPDPKTSPHAFYIRSRSGKDISQLSSYHGQENEVLFRSGSSFRILRRSENPDGTIVFTLEEVSSKE